MDLNGNLCCKPLPQVSADRRYTFLQCCLAVAHKFYRQGGIVPYPLCAGERAPGHRVQGHKQPHKLFRLDLAQLVCRMRSRQLQFPQTVSRCDLGRYLRKQALGDVLRCVDCHSDLSGHRVNIRSNQSRLRKNALQRLRRHVVRKHMEKLDLVVHRFPQNSSILFSSAGRSSS